MTTLLFNIVLLHFQVGLESLRLVLTITARYEGHLNDHDKLIAVSLEHVQSQTDLIDNEQSLHNVARNIAYAVCSHVSQQQLRHFVNRLTTGLTDVESSSSLGCSIVLNTVLKSKGAELHSQAGEILTSLLDVVDKVQCSKTRSSSLCCVLSLVTHHPKLVVSVIVDNSLPYERYVHVTKLN